YLWTLFGLFLVPDATYAANPWLRHLDHPAITYSSMIMTVYFAHFTCWQMGMLYRRHHERFPSTLQRHIPRPRPQPARPHPPPPRPSPPHAPQPGLPGAGGPADPRPGRQA